MPTNLKIKNPNIVRVAGYFYHMDITADTLYKKTDDGNNAFSYPLDSDIVNQVQSLQHDGRYFYTLENNTTANSNNGQLLIKRWAIEDFILRLKRTYTINGASNQKYNCNTFAIENYRRTLGANASSGNTTITLNDNSRLVPGDIIYFGPSTVTGDVGKYQERTVLQVNPFNQIEISVPLTVNFNSGDLCTFSNRCWFFNRFRPNDSDSVNGSGQLYFFNLNPLVTNITTAKAGNEFRTTLASMFIRDPFYGGTGREFLAFMNQTNLLFIEVDPTNINYLNTVQSASQNNQEVNTTIIPVYDITYEGNTIFRLQQKGTFRNDQTYTTEDWTPDYNYQLSALSRLPSSISLTAASGVLAADGLSTTSVSALVKDQFDEPVSGRTVNFTDNDTSGSPAGLMNPTSATTTSGGVATTSYKAGTVPKTVTITATT